MMMYSVQLRFQASSTLPRPFKLDEEKQSETPMERVQARFQQKQFEAFWHQHCEEVTKQMMQPFLLPEGQVQSRLDIMKLIAQHASAAGDPMTAAQLQRQTTRLMMYKTLGYMDRMGFLEIEGGAQKVSQKLIITPLGHYVLKQLTKAG